VGRTCGEGLETALGGTDLQNGSDDEEVGGQDEQGGGNDIGGQEEVKHRLVVLTYITCQLQQGWDITKKVINDIAITKIQSECVAG
jgi:hypothetical protein